MMQVTGHDARWEEHNSARRTRILEAAVELLDGTPAGTDIPVQQIAKRAGLAKSVVYRQFAGRDDLDRHIRTYLVDDFFATLTDRLDIGSGSLRQIITRTVQAVIDWAGDHPHRHEFLRSGPVAGDESGLDAIAVLKARVAERARDILVPITTLLGIDYGRFVTLPFAVVSMVESTASHWVRDPEPERTRAEIVADLGSYALFVLDGAARSIGLVVDADTELSEVVTRLAGDAQLSV